MRIRVEQRTGQRAERAMAHVAAVFPAYNEERHLARCVEAALACGLGLVVVVNDGSTDSTGAILDRLACDPRVQAVHHEVNLGKQAGVVHGLQAAARHTHWNAVAVLDADMQNDPALLPRLCGLIGPYDLVVGRRHQDHMPAVRRAANLLASAPYALLAGVPIGDVQSGYRVYSRETAAYLARHLPEAGRYAFEHSSMLLFARLARARRRDFRIAEVPVPCSYEDAPSRIRLCDKLQLTWATVYHAAAIARLRR
ncbi:MAG: glycosyltransferase family 2 protein [Candidatus Brocadiaceae bacterium]|nr:glycosyltransferase family 2 protein [Candidatus Brocadiaceae bacterium]